MAVLGIALAVGFLLRASSDRLLSPEAATKLDPYGLLESCALEPEPLVLITNSGTSLVPPSITFGLWSDGRGLFSDGGWDTRARTFSFEVRPADARQFADEIFEVLRPADLHNWDFECSSSTYSSARQGTRVVAVSTNTVIFVPEKLAAYRNSNPSWPDDTADPTLDASSRLAIKTQLALRSLLDSYLDLLRFAAVPVALDPAR